jgi:hypothetical protein
LVTKHKSGTPFRFFSKNYPRTHPLPFDTISQILQKEDSVILPLDNGYVYKNRAGMENLLALEINLMQLLKALNKDYQRILLVICNLQINKK